MNESSRVSLCHRWSAGSKVILTLLVITIAGIIPFEQWPAQGLLLAVVFVGLSLAGVTIRYLVRRLSVFLPMLLIFGLAAPGMASGGDTSGQSAWIWTISLWTRCTISFLAGLWLIHVLPFPELLVQLRRWNCPSVLVAMLGFMYRHIFILWDELRRLRTARAAREFGGHSRWKDWTTGASLIGLLLLRAMERAERTHRAMLARGWDGTSRSLGEP